MRPPLSIANAAIFRFIEDRKTRFERRESRQARAAMWAIRADLVRDGLESYAEKTNMLGDFDTETPILDFWERLIDSGKIQEFMAFLVNDFLPMLFDIIIAFISALSVMESTEGAGNVKVSGV